MQRPTLFLTVGLPGTGKTTAARRIEAEHDALRLTKDEWMKALFGRENPPSASDVIEGRLVRLGMRVLELGTNVVLDSNQRPLRCERHAGGLQPSTHAAFAPQTPTHVVLGRWS